MVIAHNLSSLVACGMLNATGNRFQRTIQKLSTGLRVNSAADDAAGLAISEKMRAQVRGLDQAATNAQDGVSLLQTADGALAETHAILQRMRELAVQAANDTLTGQDRSYIQLEVGELKEEIDRIGNTTQFNKRKLLNGDAAALWSSSDMSTRAIIRGGLDGVEGNYKIDIQAVPGQGAVMKTKILTCFEETEFFTYVGSGNYRDDAGEPQTVSEAAKSLDGGYSFTLVNRKNGKRLSVGLTAEAGQFSNMEEVARALNEGDLEDTEYTAYFDAQAGALAVRARGHDFDVTGSDHDLGKLFGVSYYATGTAGAGAGSSNTINVLIPTTPTVPTPPPVSQPNSTTPTAPGSTTGSLVVNTAGLTYDHTYASDGNPVNITQDGVYRIIGNHGAITVAEGVKATVVVDSVKVDTSSTGDEQTSTYGDAAFAIGKNAEVDLVLTGNSATTLTSGFGRAGLEVEESSTLRIYDTTAGGGKLKATGGYYGAGIGSAGNINADPRADSPIQIEHNAGNIIIYSGKITADATTKHGDDENYYGGAGIGGGLYGNGGTITIHGGDVTANGSWGGAGIGSGRIGYPGQESAADILITGGKIKATGHEGAAGIGGGSGSEFVRVIRANGYKTYEYQYLGKSTPSYGRIVITGGDIEAYGSGSGADVRGGAGIGGGEYNIGGEILITGGTIVAQGFSGSDLDGGAGIGGGTGGPDVNPEFGGAGRIFITGGDITAKGGSGWASSAGIGSGNRSAAGEIVITGGTINATGGNANVTWAHGGGAGIGVGSGAGYKKNGETIVGEGAKIYILGGTVTATGGFDAAGIGGGGSDNPTNTDMPTNGGEIVIAGGTVTAQGGVSGAGIGGGSYGESGAIRIQEGITVNATAGGNYYSQYTTQGNGSQYPRRPSENLQEDIGHGDHITADSDVVYGNLRLIDAGSAILTPPSRGSYTELVHKIAEPETNLSSVLELENDAGNPLFSEPQTITLTRGDGTQARVTLYADDTMDSMAKKLGQAIAGITGQGAGAVSGGAMRALTGSTDYGKAGENFAAFVSPSDATRLTSESVPGTMLFRFLPTGLDGTLAFSGNEELVESLGLNTIQSAEANEYIVNITDAHTGRSVASNVRVTGNRLIGVIHENVDVEFDALAGIAVEWDDEQKKFTYRTEPYSTILHLADNTTIFQIGANEGEELAIHIGDMRAYALGLDAVNVTSREAASRSITVIDNAIDRVSTQRAMLGAYQNRLEHTANNLTEEAENLTGAEIRIRDADMAREMMEFAKLHILCQVGTSMLSQANQLPQNVLSLLR